MEQPPGRAAPDCDKKWAADLTDCQEPTNKAKYSSSRDTGGGEADGQQDCLNGRGADHPIGDTSYRSGRDVERLLGDRAAKPAKRVLQY